VEEPKVSEFLAGLIAVMVYVAIMFTWLFGLFDLFARKDLSGLQKALWMLVVIFIPVFGVVAYFILRPKSARALFAEEQEDSPFRTRSWEMSEIQTLIRLRSQGIVTDEEYETMKGRVLNGAHAPAPAAGESA
jgi:hypothetical protein